MYRQLEEDNGTAVYAHPELAPFLRKAYRQLCLPRQIHEVAYQGETLPERSAFATQLDPGKKHAQLRSLWVGADAARTLQEHVLVLKQEGFVDIVFLLELAESREAVLGAALLAAGFLPKVVLPWGGKADILVMAHQEQHQ